MEQSQPNLSQKGVVDIEMSNLSFVAIDAEKKITWNFSTLKNIYKTIKDLQTIFVKLYWLQFSNWQPECSRDSIWIIADQDGNV